MLPLRFARRWQLATYGDFAHIVTVPGVSQEMISTFITELVEAEARPASGLGT